MRVLSSLTGICAVALLLSACNDNRQAANPIPIGPAIYYSPEDLRSAGKLDGITLPTGSVWKQLIHSDGSKSYGYICDDKPVGFWTYVYPNGRVSMQGSYLYGGVQQDAWEKWWENGNRLAKGSYDRGEKAGEWISYHKNGTRSSAGTYIQGERWGVWTSWHINGQRESVGRFEADKPSGIWRFWTDNGSRRPYINYNHPGTDWPEDSNPLVIDASGRDAIN